MSGEQRAPLTVEENPIRLLDPDLKPSRFYSATNSLSLQLPQQQRLDGGCWLLVVGTWDNDEELGTASKQGRALDSTRSFDSPMHIGIRSCRVL